MVADKPIRPYTCMFTSTVQKSELINLYFNNNIDNSENVSPYYLYIYTKYSVVQLQPVESILLVLFSYHLLSIFCCGGSRSDPLLKGVDEREFLLVKKNGKIDIMGFTQ